MDTVVSVDRRTGRTEQVGPETTTEEVDRLARRALDAAPGLVALGRTGRAALLRACADGLEAAADRDRARGGPRDRPRHSPFRGELTRTTFQLRLFAEVLERAATSRPPSTTPPPPRWDRGRTCGGCWCRSGPVAVFGASNFPLAFSVPGGDTASALAAGCPVVVKAHGSHPATSQLCVRPSSSQAAARRRRTRRHVSLVHGLRAGADLVAHPADPRRRVHRLGARRRRR